jgi:hypothetical protein
MFNIVLRALIPILAGIGVGKVADKVAADKLPNYPAEGVGTGFTTSKILWFVVSAILGTMAVKFIGKQFNIKLLK